MRKNPETLQRSWGTIWVQGSAACAANNPVYVLHPTMLHSPSLSALRPLLESAASIAF
jgi:hypothetical protein